MSKKPLRAWAFLGAALLAGLAGAAEPFEQCRGQFFGGYVPQIIKPQPAKLRDLCFDGFAVLHSGQTKTPLYVAEHLTPQRLLAARGEARTDRFYEEARLSVAERATLDDYRGNGGLDRGHLAAAGNMGNPNAMAQSFSLANIVPQASENNRGAWAKSVEAATRKYVLRGNEVYVITGPLYGTDVRTIGAGQVWVPTKLFKLVYDPARRKAWAYILPNDDAARVTKVFSYEHLVNRAGIAFLPRGAVDCQVKSPG